MNPFDPFDLLTPPVFKMWPWVPAPDLILFSAAAYASWAATMALLTTTPETREQNES